MAPAPWKLRNPPSSLSSAKSIASCERAIQRSGERVGSSKSQRLCIFCNKNEWKSAGLNRWQLQSSDLKCPFRQTNSGLRVVIVKERSVCGICEEKLLMNSAFIRVRFAHAC